MHIVIRAVVVFFTLLVAARLMGKRQISELSYLDWVVGVSIGSLSAATIYNRREIVLGWGLAGIATLALLEIITSYVALKSRKARSLMSGEPRVIVSQGQPLYENMARERFNLDNLLSMLREKEITRLADVEVATLEPDGQLGVVLKQQLKGGKSGGGSTHASTGEAKPGPH